jgi:carboxylesterase type B
MLLFLSSIGLSFFPWTATYARAAPTKESEEATSSTHTATRTVVVHLPDLGSVQGKRESGIDFFGGVPYAAPPVGNLRWAPPEPAAPWAPAKLDASHFGPDCWQAVDPVLNPLADVRQMSEDCLYLNVFTPAGHAARHNVKLPVLVWLHGGAFQMGGARRPEYDGRRLAERGTVVVTLNYRLGALGFMVSSSDGLLGNFGVMDQRAALHWIKDNIRRFGGDSDNITLFGESAGAVMLGLHLMMEGAGKLFHKAIIQSNPLGLQFRSVVVADFIGEALKRSVDCRDLACLRSERVEEILRAQSSLMGLPRSVGDFFTWGPTLTHELRLTLGPRKPGTRSPLTRSHEMFRDLESWKWQMNRDTAWAAVNVSQPLKNFEQIPDDIPVIIGSNKHEGEMFVHGAFPIPMSKAVYWMFVGALFRDSASRVLKHYRGYVDQIEKEAEELARKQIEEEGNRQYYLEHQEQLDREYHMLLDMNSSSSEELEGHHGIASLVDSWTRGGTSVVMNRTLGSNSPWHHRLWPFGRNESTQSDSERALLREEKRRARIKESALKEAAKVVLDYRPVMSRIIDDYLFRCPAWHFAQKLSRNRLRRGRTNNVYVYQFSHSTHIPGYQECWGKSCHTAELPYVFQAMDIIRSNYSTLGPYAQKEAPKASEYPYTDILAAYREAVEAADREDAEDAPFYEVNNNNHTTHSLGFQRILDHFFGNYFKEDADEEIANDMADRWTAFARTGVPNYGESRATWRPWRYVFDEELRADELDPSLWTRDAENAFDDIFSALPDRSEGGDSAAAVAVDDAFPWSDAPEERVYRHRILKALEMEVASEDVYQTMLRRISTGEGRPEQEQPQQQQSLNSVFGSLMGPNNNNKNGGIHQLEQRRTRKALYRLQQLAQEMGIMGTGMRGDQRRSLPDAWEDDFFPQMLELKWPPEDRLVERDCTCDMWDRIRCKKYINFPC